MNANTKPELLKKIKLTLQTDLDHYAPFIGACDTDPIEEMESYVNNASYDR